VNCGTIENLELDHVNPATKEIELGRLYGVEEEKFWDEVAKCQVLCRKCHEYKSILDAGNTPTKGRDVHGTLTAYRYCRSDPRGSRYQLCKDTWNKWNNEYKKRRKLEGP